MNHSLAQPLPEQTEHKEAERHLFVMVNTCAFLGGLAQGVQERLLDLLVVLIEILELEMSKYPAYDPVCSIISG